ncbi:MAG: ATP-dependent helicase C-terminal domain-containing protein, partial [Sphingomicrobium sp.]
GRAIAKLPLDPRLAHMLIEAGRRGFAPIAAEVAVLLTERGLGSNDPDLELRHRRWRGERGPRADGARTMAINWTSKIASHPPCGGGRLGEAERGEGAVSKAVALAFPDRVARRRDSSGEQYASIGGRGFRLDPTSPLARAEWLAVAEVAGNAAGARILSAAAINLADVETLFADRIAPFAEVRFDPSTNAIVARKGRRLGAIRLSSAPDPSPPAEAVEQSLVQAVRRSGLALLPWPDNAAAVRTRAAFARQHDPTIPDLGDEFLLATLDAWLLPLLAGKRRLDSIDPGQLRAVLDALLGWDAARMVDKLAPAAFASQAGTSHPIDYDAPGGPTVELRPQALYGLASHPTIAGGIALTLSLTSPAHRPIATTRDLPAFWVGSWREVAKEMRGRYPRHHWPDDPTAAVPSLKTKRAQART